MFDNDQSSSIQMDEVELHVPAITKNTTDRLIIQAELINPESVFGSINLYLNKGSKMPTTSDYDIGGMDLWSNSVGIVLRGDMICTDCMYSILVTGPPDSFIEINSYFLGSVREIDAFT